MAQPMFITKVVSAFVYVDGQQDKENASVSRVLNYSSCAAKSTAAVRSDVLFAVMRCQCSRLLPRLNPRKV